jgi:threonine dehydratase
VITREALERARERVSAHVPPTPTRRWPLIEAVTGTTTWVKHENHNPTGAFKVRGGVNFVRRLCEERPGAAGLISATRGNHGQSLAWAGATAGLPVVIVVPEGNSPDKNAAMAGFGAELIVHGRDFQESREYAEAVATERGLVAVPPFHPWLSRYEFCCVYSIVNETPYGRLLKVTVTSFISPSRRIVRTTWSPGPL